jgi:proline iminopeptidase
MKFGKAYFYRFNLEANMSEGDTIEFRPEAQIYAASRLLPGWTVMDRLGDIAAPTLVLAGRHDFLFPPEHQAILADRIPHARLELIEAAGHNPQMEQTEITIEIIRSFLADVNLDYASL